jgi:hypothetical protein
LLFPHSYITFFWELYFLPFSVHAQTNVRLPRYSRINSKRSPAAGAGNVSKPRLMSQVCGSARSRVRLLQASMCFCNQSQRWSCQYWPAYAVAAVMWLR